MDYIQQSYLPRTAGASSFHALEPSPASRFHRFQHQTQPSSSPQISLPSEPNIGKLPVPKRPFKIVIGSPMGPVLKNGKPMPQETSEPSISVSYETAYSVKRPAPVAQFRRQSDEENIPPAQQHVPAKQTFPEKQSKTARTVHALSSIAQGFARSTLSLASFRSRNFSGASTSTSTLNTVNSAKTQKSISKPASKAPSTSSRTSLTSRRLGSFSQRHSKLTLATSDSAVSPTTTTTTGQNTSPKENAIARKPVATEATRRKTRTPSPLSTSPSPPETKAQSAVPDPRLIYTAQPSAYWSGRFMSLSDKFHGELLDENILQDVLEELSSRTRPSKHLAEDNKTNDNISTTEASTPKWTTPKPSLSLYTNPKPRGILKFPPTTARTSYTSTPPTTTSKRPPLSSGISRLPFHSTTTSAAPRRQSYDAPRSTYGNTLLPAAPSIRTTSTIQPSSPILPATQRKQIILLTSDDHRSLRVFTHLSSLCATPAAQQSLRTWQTTYARKTGKEILLPPGENMRDDSPKDFRGRWAGMGRRSLSRGRRDVSVGSSNGTGGGGLVGRGLRLFSGGRKSQIAVKLERSEFGGGNSEIGGGKAWTVGEGGEGDGKVWIKRQGEAEGEGGIEGVRRLRPRRIY